MSRLTLTFALLLLPAVAFAQASRPTEGSQLPPLGAPAGTFGAGVSMTKVTHLADVSAKPGDFAGKTIRVDGTISDVCTKKGCWMVLQDGDVSVRVRFKDYGFFVPRDAGQRKALVQGVAKAEEISEETAKHYALESGKPEEAAKIKGPQQVLSFIATGVVILGSDALPKQAEVGQALLEALGAGAQVREAGDAVETPEAALALLRTLPASRAQEFASYGKLEDWTVFAADAGCSRGFAVGADGRVVRFGPGE